MRVNFRSSSGILFFDFFPENITVYETKIYLISKHKVSSTNIQLFYRMEYLNDNMIISSLNMSPIDFITIIIDKKNSLSSICPHITKYGLTTVEDYLSFVSKNDVQPENYINALIQASGNINYAVNLLVNGYFYPHRTISCEKYPENRTIADIVRSCPEQFAQIVSILELQDPEFGRLIRADPERFLLLIHCNPANFDCDSVRSIPEEFPFLTNTLRNGFRSVLKIDKNAFSQIITMLYDQGPYFSEPVLRNPEGFIRAIGMNPSDFDLSIINRKTDASTQSEINYLALINDFTNEDISAVRTLAHDGVDLPTVIQAYTICNKDFERTKLYLSSKKPI